MPTYEYRCGSCGQDTEAVQAFTDAPLTLCPACGEEALRKRFGSVGVVFKGSGFYRTDSRAEANGRKSGTKDTAGDSGKNGAGDGGKDAAKGNGKPASGPGDKAAKPAGASGATGSSAKPAAAPA